MTQSMVKRERKSAGRPRDEQESTTSRSGLCWLFLFCLALLSLASTHPQWRIENRKETETHYYHHLAASRRLSGPPKQLNSTFFC